MTIDCPICGQAVAFSQYSIEDDICFNCLQKIDIGDIVQPEEPEYDHEAYDYDED
ncbi:MAG: hypothetical protein HGA35_03545 [Erysipelotrichaceae bacterium]|nr:hypothetical protein [Erysipelotrichaceae bacterium]